jgi:DNA modification methylase
MSAPYYSDESVTLYAGKALNVLRDMPDESVDCIVTSPPYYQLRDYGVEGQQGQESTPAEYVAGMVAVFREARRVLASDGTCWLNLGDTYYSGRGASTGVDEKNPARRFGVRAVDKGGATWAKPKDLLMIPAEVAIALRNDGWYLRSDIIWAKPSPMPENVKDRPTASHEHVFLFSKSRRYHYDADAIAETASGASSGNSFKRPERTNRGGPDGDHKWEGRQQLRRAWDRAGKGELTEEHFAAIRAVGMNDAGKAKNQQAGSGRNDPRMQQLADEAKAVLGGYYREFLTGATKNARNVWEIAPTPFAEAHYATMPVPLAERCVRAGCRPGGTVLDPYSGAGTTGLAASLNGCKYIGVDLDSESLDLSLRTRLAQPVLLDGAQ